MKHLLLTIVVSYLLIIVGMYLFQRRLMYLPEQAVLNPERFNLGGYETQRLTTHDGTMITTWHHPATAGLPTILYLHGNAAHLGDEFRVERFAEFAKAGYGVLAVSWRGYGDSEGAPTEDGLYDDARSALNWLLHVQKVPLTDILLFGESLGSGVAVQMATEFSVSGVLLDSPYTSTINRAAELYPWLPVKYIMKDKFESWKKIAHIKAGQLVIFHGALDAVIPIEHGKALFETATVKKHGYFYDDLEHVSVSTQDIIAAISQHFHRS